MSQDRDDSEQEEKRVNRFHRHCSLKRAEHLLLRRPCAIKLIRSERAGNPEDLVRFEREVRTTATLTHPNTVQVDDYGHTNDGTFYYVMEYLPGMTDFGIVQSRAIADDGTAGAASGTIAGTPGFMSPEQIEGTNAVAQRSGLYSLGAVAYFLLTGAPPFLRSAADVPADLQSIVLRCLSKRPDQRDESAAAVESALARALDQARTASA